MTASLQAPPPDHRRAKLLSSLTFVPAACQDAWAAHLGGKCAGEPGGRPAGSDHQPALVSRSPGAIAFPRSAVVEPPLPPPHSFCCRPRDDVPLPFLLLPTGRTGRLPVPLLWCLACSGWCLRLRKDGADWEAGPRIDQPTATVRRSREQLGTSIHLLCIGLCDRQLKSRVTQHGATMHCAAGTRSWSSPAGRRPTMCSRW